MKTFSFFLLTIVVVTAAPAAPSTSDEQKLQHVILAEIINNVKYLDTHLKDSIKKTYVQEVITTKHCTLQNFCKTGDVLEELKAEELGLQEKDWLLPRLLVAYSRTIQCKIPESDDLVQLHDLLKNIKHCAQRMYAAH